MHYNKALFQLTFCIILHIVYAYKDGATAVACSDGKPDHLSMKPSTKPCPYTMQSIYDGRDGSFSVVIVGGDFVGFMIHALGSDGIAIGDFQEPLPENSRVIGCATFAGADTLTHSSAVTRSSLVVQWMPPAGYEKKTVHFRASIVKTEYEFWTDITCIGKIKNDQNSVKNVEF